jgi:hypothetical protein
LRTGMTLVIRKTFVTMLFHSNRAAKELRRTLKYTCF